MHPTSSPLPGPAALLQAGPQPAALDQLALGEGPALRAWLTRILRDHHRADDAVQEVWVTLLSGGWSFQPRSADADGDARAWLRQVALRLALNRRRADLAAERRHRLSAGATAPAPGPLEHLEADDQRAILMACLDGLPENLRHALVLRYHHDLDYRSIGAAQGCSALTARVRAWRGLQRLRAGLGLLGLVLGSTLTLSGVEGLDLHRGTSIRPRGKLPKVFGFFTRPLPLAAALLVVGASCAWIWSTAGSPPKARGESSWDPRPDMAPMTAVHHGDTVPLSIPHPQRNAQPPEPRLPQAFLATAFRWDHSSPLSSDRIVVVHERDWHHLIRQHAIAIAAEAIPLHLSGLGGELHLAGDTPLRGKGADEAAQTPSTALPFSLPLRSDPKISGKPALSISCEVISWEGTAEGDASGPVSLMKDGVRLTMPNTTSSGNEDSLGSLHLAPTEFLVIPPGQRRHVTLADGTALEYVSREGSDVWMLLKPQELDGASHPTQETQPDPRLPAGRS